MILDALVVGPFESNAYVVGCERTRAALLVDAGDDAERIIERVRLRELEPRLLALTHGHADHLAAAEQLKQAFPRLQIAVHEADAKMLLSATANLSFFLGTRVLSPPAEMLLQDASSLEMGDLVFKVIHTPGHTAGGICLLCEHPGGDSPGVVFTGDTLFAGGIGRTDLPGGNMETLLASIRERLLVLPPETIIYPGHGPDSTIGNEKAGNPFLEE